MLCLFFFYFVFIFSQQQMSKVINEFKNHVDSMEISNDFRQFWQSTWKPITQKCLNVAKHTFVMKKAFEMFQSKMALALFTNETDINWSVVFIDDDETQLLQSLCRHVGLNADYFLYYGLGFHKKRCHKYYSKKKNQL